MRTSKTEKEFFRKFSFKDNPTSSDVVSKIFNEIIFLSSSISLEGISLKDKEVLTAILINVKNKLLEDYPSSNEKKWNDYLLAQAKKLAPINESHGGCFNLLKQRVMQGYPLNKILTYDFEFKKTAYQIIECSQSVDEEKTLMDILHKCHKVNMNETEKAWDSYLQQFGSMGPHSINTDLKDLKMSIYCRFSLRDFFSLNSGIRIKREELDTAYERLNTLISGVRDEAVLRNILNKAKQLIEENEEILEPEWWEYAGEYNRLRPQLQVSANICAFIEQYENSPAPTTHRIGRLKDYVDFRSRVLKGKSNHELLGVDRGASNTEIKKAFKKYSLAVHPNNASEKPTEAAHLFNILNEAKDKLLQRQG